MVLVQDVPFASLCEHHLVPFIGQAHVASSPGPNGNITGLSKLARLVDGFARRPQVQERLTMQIADAIGTVLEPTGCWWSSRRAPVHVDPWCPQARFADRDVGRAGPFRDDARARPRR